MLLPRSNTFLRSGRRSLVCAEIVLLAATLLLGTIFLLAASSAFAHHGWRWTADEKVEVFGIIESATLGNPHGVLILDVEGEKWTAEVGQPWRNHRAGLTDAMLVKGVELKIRGQKAADTKELRVKAERVLIGDKVFDLYPDRE